MNDTPTIRILALSCFLIFSSNGIFSQESRQNEAVLLEKSLNEQGIEEAQKIFEEILSDTSQYLLQEYELNVLGYQLARQGKFEEAKALFQMNVQAFPGSWNVCDSLGEMLAWTGNKEAASENFEKSLELNPQNENAVKNLSQIYGTRSDQENETKSEFRYRCGEPTNIDEPYFGEDPPGLIPKLFAPGIVSTHGNFEFASTFSPDGKYIFYTKSRDIYWVSTEIFKNLHYKKKLCD